MVLSLKVDDGYHALDPRWHAMKAIHAMTEIHESNARAALGSRFFNALITNNHDWVICIAN